MKRVFIFLSFIFLLTSSYVESATKVKMAYLQSDIHHLPLWVAIEEGFFKKLNVKIDIAGVFKAGPEIMSAFGAGALDMAYVGEAPSTTAVANHTADVQAIAQVNTEGSALVVNKDISSFKDLKNKTIAIPGYSTVQDFLLRKALIKNRLNVKDINLLVIKPPEMISSLKRKDIDGFIAWEPYPSKAVISKAGKILINSHSIWPNHPCCVLVSSRIFLKKHKEIVKKVLKAHIMAINFINKNPEEAVKIGVRYTGFEYKVVKNAMKNVRYTYRLSVEGEKEYVQFLRKFGYLKVKDIDTFLRKFLNQDLIKEVLKQ